MRIAAIDIGSNSSHMVIVESRSGGFHVIDREKEMVRLGQRTLSRGRLSAASMRRGLDAREYKRLADMHGVDKLPVVATSAVREAANGEDFLERVGGEICFYPQVVWVEWAVSETSRGLRLHCEVEDDAGLEQWASGRRVDLLERALDQPLRVDFAPVAAVTAVRARAGGA